VAKIPLSDAKSLRKLTKGEKPPTIPPVVAGSIMLFNGVHVAMQKAKLDPDRTKATNQKVSRYDKVGHETRMLTPTSIKK
jgi:hypothetical protein